MVVITDKTTFVVLNYSNSVVETDADVRVGNVVFPKNVASCFTVENIPTDINPNKFCYTEADGFYPNPNWHEPSAYDLAPTEVVNAIIDEYTNELIEMGVL